MNPGSFGASRCRAVELEVHADPIQCAALCPPWRRPADKKNCAIIFIAGLLSGAISLRDSPALYSHNRNNNSHHPSREIPVLIRISYGLAVTPIFTADFMHTRQKTTISPVRRLLCHFLPYTPPSAESERSCAIRETGGGRGAGGQGRGGESIVLSFA